MPAVFWIMCWSLATWTLAAVGLHGWALVAAAGALAHGATVALASLVRDKQCHVCGQPYDVGTLGMHETCARSTRLVRR